MPILMSMSSLRSLGWALVVGLALFAVPAAAHADDGVSSDAALLAPPVTVPVPKPPKARSGRRVGGTAIVVLGAALAVLSVVATVGFAKSAAGPAPKTDCAPSENGGDNGYLCGTGAAAGHALAPYLAVLMGGSALGSGGIIVSGVYLLKDDRARTTPTASVREPTWVGPQVTYGKGAQVSPLTFRF
jgi:hypothetical protein